MEIRARLTKKEGRRFAFTVGIAFVVFGAITWWRGHEILRWVLWGLGAVLLVLGIVIPGRLSRIYHAWMGLGHAISKVTSPIVMGVVYYLMLTPIGFVSRSFGRNPLRHHEKDGGYWMPATSGKPSDLENQF